MPRLFQGIEWVANGPQQTGDGGAQVEDKWETSVKSCGQSTHKRVETVGDKWEPNVKSCGQLTHKGLETVGDKWETNGRQV